jgi:vancomycin resistance protein VanJ
MLKNFIPLEAYLFSFLKKFWIVPSILFWRGLWLFGLSLLLWYPLRWWPGDRLLPVRLLNYFMPWLLVGLLPSLLVAGLAHRYRLLLLLAVPTIFIGLTFAPLFLPRPRAVLAASTPLKVMSYNVWHHNPNIADPIAIIRGEQPDILLLQEVYSPHLARIINDELADLYPKGNPYFAYESRIGQAVISRYPITKIGITYHQGRTQKVLVDTPDGFITVWNVHPLAPLAWSRQYRQISALAEEIAAVEGPLIVGGDFNTTDQAETYRLINQHLSNAHWQAGWGFGFSFPAHAPRFKRLPIITPMVRIDHIFYSSHFFAHNAHTLSISGGSDHLPVVAELSLVR